MELITKEIRPHTVPSHQVWDNKQQTFHAKGSYNGLQFLQNMSALAGKIFAVHHYMEFLPHIIKALEDEAYDKYYEFIRCDQGDEEEEEEVEMEEVEEEEQDRFIVGMSIYNKDECKIGTVCEILTGGDISVKLLTSPMYTVHPLKFTIVNLSAAEAKQKLQISHLHDDPQDIRKKKSLHGLQDIPTFMVHALETMAINVIEK